MLPASAKRCRKIWYPVQTKAADGGTKPLKCGEKQMRRLSARVCLSGPPANGRARVGAPGEQRQEQERQEQYAYF